MDRKRVFDILGISDTKNKNDIKTSYRKKLVDVNPEDNPEGFRALREAYEEAVRLADMQEDILVEDTPIQRWIQRVENTYNRLSSRIDAALWRDLVEEEICKDFDMGNEAKEAFLGFLMSHYRLPVEIWEILEDVFQLVDTKEELYEKFPRDFVDFIIEDPKRKGWMDYTLFEGDEEADIDDFIDQYLSVRRMNDTKEYDEIEKALEQLDFINLWHPYLEIEKMRYYGSCKRYEVVKEMIEALRSRKYKDLYIEHYIAEASLEMGDIESAYEGCRAILEANPDHFGAKSILYSYYLRKEEYKNAKDGYIELLEIDPYNQSLLEGMKQANQGLICNYQEQLKNRPDDKELKIELGWCLFQNNLYQECIALIQDIEVEDKIYYDFHNLISRVYMEVEEYEKAYPYIQRWIDEILKVREEKTDEAKKRLNRLPLAYYLISRCYYHFSTEKEETKESPAQCIQYLDLAIQAEGNGNDLLKYLSAKAYTLLKLEEYSRSIDVCDEMIRLNERYYLGYVYRQEACFHLKMGQEVVDDYYKAIEIYPGNGRPYLLAAKVFIAHEQYEDAQGVIRRAKDANVESDELGFQELKIRRLEENDNKKRIAIAIELEALYEKAREREGDLEDISVLFHELALCYLDMGQKELALDAIEKKLQIRKTDGSMELKGYILYSLSKYKEAIVVYEEVRDQYPDYGDVYYRLGNCYETIDEKTMLDYYLKVIEIDPEHRFVNNKLMKFYQSSYKRNHRREDYQLAVSYGKQQVAIEPTCYDWNALGLVYLDGYDLQDALKAFEEARKCDETDMYPYNNIGFTYKILGDFEEAYKYYILAMERRETGELITHWNMAMYYRITGQYQKAIETYEFIAQEREDPKETMEERVEVYRSMGEWNQAIEQSKRSFEMGTEDEMDYLLEVGEIHCYAGNYAEGMKYYKRALKKYPKKSDPYSHIGEYMLWVLGNKKKALKYYKKAYQVAKKYDSKYENYEDDLLYDILYALKSLGREKKGISYVDALYRYMEKHHSSIEQWLDDPWYRKIRLYWIAVWNYSIGRYDKSQHYMELMKKAANCRKCSYSECFEYYRLEGMMLELQEDYQGALVKYEKALELCPDNIYHISKVREMRQKGRDKQL